MNDQETNDTKKEHRRSCRAGYTLVEMLIVIAIIAILASIAFPRFAQAVQNARSSSVQENLYRVRNSINLYYSDITSYPTDLSALNDDYLSVIPVARIPDHADSNLVTIETAPSDAGGWSYNNTIGDPNYGTLVINCTHTDTNGKAWSAY